MNARGTRRPSGRSTGGRGGGGGGEDKITVGEMMGCAVLAIVGSGLIVLAGATGVGILVASAVTR